MKIIVTSVNGLTKFEVDAIALSIQENIFNKRYYDITEVRNLAETLGVGWKLHSKTFNTLRLLHCISYSEMSDEVRIETWKKTLDLLGIEFSSEPLEKREAEVKIPQRWLPWKKK